MSLSQFEEAVGHRRGADPGPNEAWYHGCEIVSPVEAVFELGEVAWDVLAVDGPAGADNRGLDVAQRGIDPFEGRGAHCRGAASSLDGLVGAPGIGDAGKALEPITHDRATRTEAALGKGGQCLVGETADPSQLDANRLAIRRGLDRGDERGFPRRPRPRLPPERSPPR